ncbi:MAG: porin [Sutterellaceae bacterium]|nr:porin [Sutterellaceae bacterium]
MKKTLAAVAVLGAFAGSALAADVTLYGVLDTSLMYNHIDLDNGSDATDKLSMEAGQQSGNRFGFKGTEDLGNGLTVGFVLENGFSGDTGALKDKNSFFNREASLFVQGAFGKIAFGKIGSINQGTSSWGKVGNYTSAFGTSNWGNYSAQAGSTFALDTVRDNTIAYETPSFAGAKVYAQYSMGDTVEGNVENESSSNRYYVIGATYDNGPIGAYFAVDSINYKSWNGAPVEVDDSLTVTLGFTYDFEVAKLFLGAQYFDEVAPFGNLIKDSSVGFAGKIKGYGLNVSTSVPVAGGKVLAGIGYVDAEAADSVTAAANKDNEFQRYVVTAGYDYPFSKRTDVYAVASWMQDSVDYGVKGTDDRDLTAYTFVVGLRHKF